MQRRRLFRQPKARLAATRNTVIDVNDSYKAATIWDCKAATI